VNVTNTKKKQKYLKSHLQDTKFEKKRVLFKMKIIRDKTVIFKKTAKFNGILEMQIQR
jgi:hypothetical protein